MLERVTLQAVTPTAPLREHVAHALGLGLPTLGMEPWELQAPLTVIGSGPSARDWTGPRAHTLAVNGMLRVLADQGRAPSFWAACDPQALVADFIPDDAPRNTLYLVASKCHPSVFEKLAQRDVILWHVYEAATFDMVEDKGPVIGGHSVTSCAFNLGVRLGYRRFDVYGWDLCRQDGETHATGHADAREAVVNSVGERDFTTSLGWMIEAQQAVGDILPRYDITLHGDGMLKAMWELCR